MPAAEREGREGSRIGSGSGQLLQACEDRLISIVVADRLCTVRSIKNLTRLLCNDLDHFIFEPV